MPTAVRSFCKINLGLAVGPPRPDGFHGLTTAYQTLALFDVVTVTAKPAAATRITLEADHPGVPSTARGDAERNTAYRMVAGALARLGSSAEVFLKLEKRLPVQGGLGAGSANAVAALLGLERELGIALSKTDRLELAETIGSDVPLFLLGGTVVGINRGEAVFPLPDSPALPVVVAIPGVGVSTAQAFRDLDRDPDRDPDRRSIGQTAEQSLTQPTAADRLWELSRVLASVWTHTGVRRVPTGIVSFSHPQPSGGTGLPSEILDETEGDLAGNPGFPPNLLDGVEHPLLALVRTGVENDFEAVAFQQHPSLRDIKRALAGSSDSRASEAAYAGLSGSGSALFGIYTDPGAAREAQQRVQALGARALLTETLDRRGYWQRMFA